jgi:hypothetical protein
MMEKVTEWLGEVQRQIVKTAVEAMLEKGVTVETGELNIIVNDSTSKPILKVTLNGKFTVKSLKQEVK